ncbi:MAG: replication initiation protein, partial [Paraclostridium sp.]
MELKKEILLQPNNLVKSKYDFTIIENKLFYKILYNAQKQSSNKPIYHAIIKVDEFKEFIKDKNICTEQNIKEMLNLFQQSILEFDYIDEKGTLRTFGSGLINTYDFNRDNDEYEITMHETLYNHITDFINLQRKGYTPLNMGLLFSFKGAYTQRLYTLMRLWSREKKEVEIKYSLDEIREYLKLKPDVYPEYKHFKQKVIKRALKEINEKGNMQVEIKQEIRKGRKIDEIVFLVIDHEPRKYFDKKNNDLLEIPYKENEIIEAEATF